MKHLKHILEEAKKEKEKKIVFKETDPNEPFPNDTMTSLSKEINKQAKDLEKEWDSAIQLVDHVFEELNVPKPMLFNKKRWEQYTELLGDAVKNLYDSRGFKANWSKTI